MDKPRCSSTSLKPGWSSVRMCQLDVYSTQLYQTSCISSRHPAPRSKYVPSPRESCHLEATPFDPRAANRRETCRIPYLLSLVSCKSSHTGGRTYRCVFEVRRLDAWYQSEWFEAAGVLRRRGHDNYREADPSVWILDAPPIQLLVTRRTILQVLVVWTSYQRRIQISIALVPHILKYGHCEDATTGSARFYTSYSHRAPRVISLEPLDQPRSDELDW